MGDEINPNSPNGRVRSFSGERSRTKQSDALMSDVNGIVARHIAHKIPLPDGGGRYAYGDFSAMGDFHTEFQRVKEAQDSFLKLPAHVRKHCHNDVGEFLEMVHDPNRAEECEKLGLMEIQRPASSDVAVEVAATRAADAAKKAAEKAQDAPGGATS